MTTLGDIAGTQFHTFNIHNTVKDYCIFVLYNFQDVEASQSTFNFHSFARNH